METHIYTKRFGTAIHRTVLPCGTNIFTAPIKSRMVKTQLVFPFGAYDDGPLTGTGHCHEHLVIKGPNRDGIHPAIVAVRPKGVKYDAGTSYFHTEYSLRGLAEDYRSIQQALLRFSLTPAFTREQLELECGVILQEERQGAVRTTRASWFQRQAYPHEPRLHIPVIGTPEDIQRIDMNALENYIERTHVLDVAAFFCAGGISHEEHVAEIVSALANHRTRDIQKPSRKTLPLTLFNGTWKNHHVEQSGITWFFNPPSNRRERMLLSLAEEMLEMPDIGILFRKLRSEERLVYSLSINTTGAPMSHTHVWIPVAEEHFERATELFWNGIDELLDNRFEQELIETVLTNRRIFFAQREERRSSGQLIDWMTDLWLDDDYEDYDVESFLLSATRDQIVDVAKKSFRRDAHGLIYTLPE